MIAILALSIVTISSMQGQLVMAASSSSNKDIANNNDFKQLSKDVSTLPQPNDSPVVTAKASNALFEPAAGLANVFGPKGLFPMTNVFKCADKLTCGVSAGSDAKFTGTFELNNKNGLTGYEAIYKSPVTYGPQQIAGHTYKLTLTDIQWNNNDVTKKTRQPDFTKQVNNVGMNQIQHGASYIDRSDIPQLFDNAFLYGHVKVTDITGGKDKVVAQDVFTHVMVAHFMDQSKFYKDLTDTAKSKTMVILFAVNIPPDKSLPAGVGKLSPEKAISFTPLPSDPALRHPPQFDYPVKLPAPDHGSIKKPLAETNWPVDNPKQPLFFTFLVFQNTDAKSTSSK